MEDVSHTIANQRDVGSPSELLTPWMSCGITLERERFGGRCTHPKRWLISDIAGKWKVAKPRTVKGTETCSTADNKAQQEVARYPATLNE